MKKKELVVLNEEEKEVIAEFMTGLLSGKYIEIRGYREFPSNEQYTVNIAIQKHIEKLVFESHGWNQFSVEASRLNNLFDKFQTQLDALKSEEFIDKVIDRINRKQLGGK